jgi:hypothetical protein
MVKRPPEPVEDEKPRQLSRHETHDLGMIIKDRTKVLRAHAEEEAARCMSDFDKQLAAAFSWEDDEIWQRVTEEAAKYVKEAQAKIAARAAELGIPKTFAPKLVFSWAERGENATSQRRTELRRVAKSSIDAMLKAAITRIEQQSLDLRTQVVAMGVLSSNAKLFLESLAPVEEAMRALDFEVIERRLEQENQQRAADRRRLGY